MTRYKRPNNVAVTPSWLKDFTVEDFSGCWIWQRSCNADGYGQVRYKGEMRLAHRVMYEVTFRIDPENHCVLHTCDTPPCINPEHLYQGDQLDNATDRENRGRGGGKRLQGTFCHTAKLTEKKVKAIRKDTRSERTLAKLYDVAPSTIHCVKANQTWQNV